MNEAAKIELEHRVSLYQFYINSYIKGIAFYLAITGVFLKFALESSQYRDVFSAAGVVCNLTISIPLIFAFRHEIKMKEEFLRLASLTGTEAIQTAPLRMLSVATSIFWLILSGSWFYVWKVFE